MKNENPILTPGQVSIVKLMIVNSMCESLVSIGILPTEEIRNNAKRKAEEILKNTQQVLNQSSVSQKKKAIKKKTKKVTLPKKHARK